jgi:hypothetical protein
VTLSCQLEGRHADYEVFIHTSMTINGHSLVTLGSPLEQTISNPADYSAPLMRFFLPIARNDLSLLNPGLPHPIRSVFRFSQPLNGLLLKPSCGLVSCHWHSWDSLFRVFPLKAASHPRRVRLPVKFPYLVSTYTSPAK